MPAATLERLKRPALFWFTLSGLLASYVGGWMFRLRFFSMSSPHMRTVISKKVWWPLLLPVNAAVVVAPQYALGRKITASNIVR